MTTIDKSKPVLVTGATGYVAGWLVKKLLDEGITVHAAVRDPGNTDKLKFLNDLASKSSGTIKYFKSDLLQPGSYAEAMEDCELVYHTASPFTLNVKDKQRDLIDPALKGTANVLETANKTPSVKRVVVTSSCAAIYGDNIDVASAPNQTLTEEVWNTTSTVSHQAYSYSKVVAEKKAWEMQKAQDRWDLVVVNPSFVIGPGINPKGTSESFNIIKQMVDGTMKFGAPEFNIGAVDVRDLAIAHYNAGFIPTARGRNIASAENTSFLELASHLRVNFPKLPLPKKTLPKWLVVLMAPASGMSRKEAKLSVGHPWKADNSKSIKELNMEYRPLTTTINDMVQQQFESGFLKG